MSGLRALLADYLLLRRSLGYKLVRAEALLDEFVSYLEGAGVPHITVPAALSWAVLPPNVLSNWRAQRLGVVRCFARYCNVIDPSHQVPPTGLVSRGRGRPAPFIYSAEQVGVLMRAARDLRHAQRAATLEAVVGLMAVSGMRVAEVVPLTSLTSTSPRGHLLSVRPRPASHGFCHCTRARSKRFAPMPTPGTVSGPGQRRRGSSSRAPAQHWPPITWAPHLLKRFRARG